MTIPEEDYLWLSGLQNFAFCRRQWALMRLEGIWNDNKLTAEGSFQHKKAHDRSFRESRGNVYIARGLRIVSHRMHLSGECDVVEFKKDSSGVNITGKDGLWLPCPIEYKHGKTKSEDVDRIQVCAEAMCLEEMLCCEIPYGFLFYQEIKRREKVNFTEELRNKVIVTAKEMWDYQIRNYTPNVKPSKKCTNCSIKDQCLAKLSKAQSVHTYLNQHIKEGKTEP